MKSDRLMAEACNELKKEKGTRKLDNKEEPGLQDSVHSRVEDFPKLRRARSHQDCADVARAVLVKTPGGAEVLRCERVTVPWPKADEVLLRQEAVGINFVDIHHRRGNSRQPDLYPFIPGMEAAGVVVALGPNVTGLKVGARVAYATATLGAYTDLRVVPSSWLVPLPASLSFTTAAGGLLKGLTARVLLETTCKIQPGSTVLVQAAAGGVGSLLCQMLRSKGAYVIGAVGSEDKIAYAKAAGCHLTFLSTHKDFVEAVSAATLGMGVDAVFDGVGGRVSVKSLNCLRAAGALVLFGVSSGAAPKGLDPRMLCRRQIRVFSVSVLDIIKSGETYKRLSAEVLEQLAQKTLVLNVRQNKLTEASLVHSLLESRRTMGSLVLVADNNDKRPTQDLTATGPMVLV